MITKFITQVSVKFNPFSPCAKPARLFLTRLPPKARSLGTTISTTILPKGSLEPSSIGVKFKDGQHLDFNCTKVSVKGVLEDCDRLSRQLQKKADLSN